MRSIGDTPGNQARKLKAIASGEIPSGNPVVVNTDNTVSSVTATVYTETLGSASIYDTGILNSSFITYAPNVQKMIIGYTNSSTDGYYRVGTVSSSNTISYGSTTAFDTGQVNGPPAITFDRNSNRVVIVYRDSLNANYGTALVGSISGTTITFGSKVVFESSATSNPDCVFDSTNNKIVIVYRNSSNYGKVIVGDVSGTSISFGTSVIFKSAITITPHIAHDSASGKVVILYGDNPSSNAGRAIVGTVSGTSISLGSETDYNSGECFGHLISYDSSSNKMVAVYKDYLNSNYLSAKVGTVSGTSITFSNSVVAHAAVPDQNEMDIIYDSKYKTIVVAYRNTSNLDYGTYVTGTVSGNTITFGTPTVFSSAATEDISLGFDESVNKVVISYRGTGSDGIVNVLQVAGVDTNLTAENYIGLSPNGYADGQDATIDIKGAINEKQSGLTPGRSYYVQVDGTLSTTSGNPSVFAGTALTANKLIVKG